MLAHDLRSARRAIVRGRFVSTLAVVAFALGIGVTTAVFGIFSGVLIEPLPFPRPEQLVAVYDTQPSCDDCPASYPKYVDWRERNTVFAAIGGISPGSFVMTGRGDPVRVTAFATTASLADVFEVAPEIGRWYGETEDRPGGPKVVVLSHEFWATRFGGDRGIVGRTVAFDGASYEVIGVLPGTFRFRRNADVFVPLQQKLDPATRGRHFLQTFARLKPGVTVERAAAEMRTLGRALAREFGTNHGIDVRAYRETVVGNIRTPLYVLMGAVVCVLLIACANVANLLLASGIGRRREMAVRLALGASRIDLLRQLTLESVLLAVAGGALGVVLARWIVGTFVALAGAQLPRAATIGVDGRVVAFAVIVSLAVGLLCGVWPVAALWASDVASAVREGDTRVASGAGRRFGDGLVVVEIALTFTLLVAASLLVKNLVMLRSRDPGIRPDRIVAFDVAPSGLRYDTPEKAVVFYRALYQRLSTLDGVESVGMTSHLPMYRFGYNGYFNVEGGTPWGPDEAPLAEYRWYYGDYLKTMGIRLIEGRALDDRDRSGSTAVLVNRAMAEKFWPGKDPIGKRFGQDPDPARWYQVVGVVSDVRSAGLDRRTPFEFYRTIDQSPFLSMTVVARTRGGDPTAIVPVMRQAVASIDPSLPIAHVQTMEQVVSESLAQPRLMSSLTSLFGGLAGLLAMVGVYGVMAYNVRRQTRELGIRLALGASPVQIRNLIVGRGLAIATAGIVFGVALAWALGRLMISMLNDVRPADPSVFGGIIVAVLAIAGLATWLPARAASNVDPAVTLRE